MPKLFRTANPIVMSGMIGSLGISAVSAVSAMVGCGYKAPPSPLFDEQERFGDDVQQRKRQQAEEAQQQSSRPESPKIFVPESQESSGGRPDLNPIKKEKPTPKPSPAVPARAPAPSQGVP